jgi:hypothetical protein
MPLPVYASLGPFAPPRILGGLISVVEFDLRAPEFGHRTLSDYGNASMETTLC